ncbi:MAG: phosphoglucomutase/phosphomannomutase family protein [Acidobacteriia bacterium]|nr:phosphoglucomutase/phosphomannomutase family protein [Terriglobia bacterium]
MALRFGTSGWRGIIAEEVTFANVRLVVEAIARYLQGTSGAAGRVIIGYDTRFLSRAFAEEAARTLLAHNVRVDLCHAPTPTPTIAYGVIHDKRATVSGALNITASHNPPEYNGIKFSSSDGGPALPQVTHAIETVLEKLTSKDVQQVPQLQHPHLHIVKLEQPYIDHLARLVDFDAIRKSKLHLVYDPQHGVGASVIKQIAKQFRILLECVNDNPDPSFGGHAPDPSENHLQDLRQAMKASRAGLGISTDGDADRFGVLDRDGSFIIPNDLIGLAADYLIVERRLKGGIGRSVATTHLLDAVAAYHDRKLLETPVGFKYVGDLIKHDELVIGGEESAGLSIRGHVPEKDGILACLLAAEMVAVRRKSLQQQRRELFRRVGAFYNSRINIQVSQDDRKFVQKKIENLPGLFNNLAGFPAVEREISIDGRKVIFKDGAWVLVRLSGTEPVARCYCEASTPAQLRKLQRALNQLLAV